MYRYDNKVYICIYIYIVVQLLTHVQLFAIPWTAACQASLSFIMFQGLLKLMSIESVMPSNHLILCHPVLLLPSIFTNIRSFPMSQLFASGSQIIGTSASASVLPMNIQGWFPLGLTGLISLLSKEFSRVFSSTTIWKHQFFSTQPSLWANSQVCDYWKNHSFDYTELCQQSDALLFNMLSRFVIVFFQGARIF